MHQSYENRGIRVVSFETDSKTYKTLRELVDQHGVRASTFLRAALNNVIDDIRDNGAAAIERAIASGGKAMGRPKIHGSDHAGIAA